jgi:hypothetical protein
VALGQVFSEYFGFPCQFAFHRLLHNHLFTWGWNNRPNSGRRAKWTRSHPTRKTKTEIIHLIDYSVFHPVTVCAAAIFITQTHFMLHFIFCLLAFKTFSRSRNEFRLAASYNLPFWKEITLRNLHIKQVSIGTGTQRVTLVPHNSLLLYIYISLIFNQFRIIYSRSQ